MLNYNQKMEVIFADANILIARNENCFAGLGGVKRPTTDAEQQELDRIKGLRTYNEVKRTNKRNPYKEFMNQF